METIWLQRSSPDIPWGFRLVGGREFGVPLTIQRVTPGSVAAAGLGPGDLVLKVGNVMATNLEHNDAMELVKQAGNILQLTIKKSDGMGSPGPLSPSSGSGYGTAQVNDNSGYSSAPKGFGTGIPINISFNASNAAPNYATTPRNYGSQQNQPQGTRIEIQRVNPPQQKSGYTNNYYNDDNADSGGPSFPDYTIPYKQQEPIHDSPGGPANIRGFVPPNESNNYNSKSLPRGVSGYNNADGFGGAGGPPAYEPRSYDTNQSSFSPSATKFSTGLPFQASQPQQPQRVQPSTPQSYQPSYNSTPSSAPQSYNSAPRPFSPPSYSGPLSPRSQSGSSSAFVSNDRNAPGGFGSNNFDQSNIHGSGSNTYSTLPHNKPSYNTNNNNSYSIYNSAPQPYSAPKPYTPAQPSSDYSSGPFSPSQPRPYQGPMSPSSGYQSQPASSGYQSQPAIRRVSFDQNVQDNGSYSPSANFSPRPYKSPPPVTSGFSGPGYQRSNSQQDNYGVSDFSAPVPQSYSRQSSRGQDPYGPSGGPMSPRSGYGGYDPSGVSAGMDNLNMGSPRYEPPPPAAPAPPPPPPPPPSGPPPPPAPPLSEWQPTPYRRPKQPSEEPDEQKVPDQLLNTMLKSAKGGGPKPFSYGIDLSELKKKVGPPTAPKPRPGKPGSEGYEQPMQVPRQPGPPKKPAGYVQQDYFIPRDYDDQPQRAPKKPAGYVQSDYFLSRDQGPRSEIDESPINLNMGTNPKKQSKSFKVLQWMTETEKEDPEEPAPKPKRPKDPERRHNADDDEMRFSGLHSKADIPSKAFGRLQKMPVDNTPATQNGKDTLDVGDAEDGVGNYDETSIRYKGKHIPSPSFRVLQTWAEHDPDPNINTTGSKKQEEEDDDLPDTLSSEDMVDKRYKGGHIPSKVFKTLQKSVGDDTPEVPEPTSQPAPGGGQPATQANAPPISDF